MTLVRRFIIVLCLTHAAGCFFSTVDSASERALESQRQALCGDQTQEAESMWYQGPVTTETSPSPTHRAFNGGPDAHIVASFQSEGNWTDFGNRVLLISARGEPAGGVWPRVQVWYQNYQLAAEFDVNTPHWQTYRVPVQNGFGATTYSWYIKFVNPGVVGQEQRRLRVDKVDFRCAGMFVAWYPRAWVFPADWMPTKKIGADGAPYIQDYSYAGYRYGSTPPVGQNGVKTVITVSATDSVADAVQAANTGPDPDGYVIELADNTEYTVTSPLEIRKSIVLRGAGIGRTKLRFELPNDDDAIHFLGEEPSGEEADIVPEANSLGYDVFDRTLRIDSSDLASFAVGDEIRIGWTNTVAFRQRHHPGASMVSGYPWWNGFEQTPPLWREFFRRRIEHIEGDRVVLDIPLRYPIRMSYVADDNTTQLSSPKIFKVGAVSQHYITECGIESLSISTAVDMGVAWPPLLPSGQAPVGRSAILFTNAKDCWAANIASYEGRPTGTSAGYHLRSHGITVEKSRLITIQDVALQKAQNRGEGGNGYLFQIGSGSHEILLNRCSGLGGRHNFSVNNYGFGASGLVFREPTTTGSQECSCARDGTCGQPLSMPICSNSVSDFHHALATGNLVDRPTINDGWQCLNRTTNSSGAGNTCTATTFWNSRGTGTLVSWQADLGHVVGWESGLNVVTAASSASATRGRRRKTIGIFQTEENKFSTRSPSTTSSWRAGTWATNTVPCVRRLRRRRRSSARPRPEWSTS